MWFTSKVSWKNFIQEIIFTHAFTVIRYHFNIFSCLCWLMSVFQLLLCRVLISILSYMQSVAPHSNTLAWKILWTEESGRLQSMGSLRVGYNCVTSLSLFTLMHWRRKWQPTPVFFLGESQGWGSLVGCRLWGHTESDMTEVT